MAKHYPTASGDRRKPRTPRRSDHSAAHLAGHSGRARAGAAHDDLSPDARTGTGRTARTGQGARTGQRADTGRAARTPQGAKPGSRSAGHRGWRPDEADRPAKRRWSSDEKRTRDDRAARPARDDRAGRPARDDRAGRPARDDRAARTAHDDRAARPARDDRAGRRAQGERPDWSPRGDRPHRAQRRDWAPRGERPDWQPRKEWRPREEREPRGERRQRDEATPYTRAPRDDRPSWRDREPRDDRARRSDRPDRTRRADRTDRTNRTDRGQTETAELRPAFVPPTDVVHERLEAQAVAADAGSGMGFADLGLGANLVRQLGALGATEPFPIQAATIPQVLAGRDVLGRGRTGSGKTIAFGAPLVERLLQLHRDRHPEGAKGRSMGRSPRALILAPTRELAQQIDRTVQPLARSVGLFTISIVGGVPYQRQLTGLRRGVDIVIGTPGRIQDLVDKGELDLGRIEISVIDEADHMCDLGFLEPVQELLRLTPAGSQRLLFSATLDRAVESLVAEFLTEPSVHEVEGEDQASSRIHHRVLVIDAGAKRDILKELVGGAGRAIVFSRTRVFAEDVAEVLDDAGIAAVSMHGDLGQAKRNRSLAALARGQVRALVATDVAARGIHVDDVELVVQADMPDDHKTYLHRAGRTGRAGAPGTVVTVIGAGRRRRMQELLEAAGIEADWEDRSTSRPSRTRPRY